MAVKIKMKITIKYNKYKDEHERKNRHEMKLN